MPLALLLVVVGAVAVDGGALSARGVDPSHTPATANATLVAQPGPSIEARSLDPLALWQPLRRTLQWFSLRPARLNPEIRPLENQRTGVTCTLRILETKPAVDAGMVLRAPGSHPDAIVRSSLSPCVE